MYTNTQILIPILNRQYVEQQEHKRNEDVLILLHPLQLCRTATTNANTNTHKGKIKTQKPLRIRVKMKRQVHMKDISKHRLNLVIQERAETHTQDTDKFII